MNYLLSELLNDIDLSSKQNVGHLFNSIQDRCVCVCVRGGGVRVGGWGRQKGPLTSFVTVTFANVGISFQNSLTFSFNPFTTPV